MGTQSNVIQEERIEDRIKGDTSQSVLIQFEGIDLTDAEEIYATFRNGKVNGNEVKRNEVSNGLTINSATELQVAEFICDFNNGVYFCDVRIVMTDKTKTYLRLIFNVIDTTND